MDPLHEAPLDDGRRPPHPFVYTLLIVPFGASSGFVTVALAFLATKNGLTVEQGAGLVAASIFPNVWKFFWAPIADKTLTRKRWYLIANTVVSAAMFGMAVVPLKAETLPLITVIVLVSSFAATFVGFSVESLVAHITPEAQRGTVSGWFQAGNLGGAGIGGGLGLWLLEEMPAPWIGGVVIAGFCLVCCAALPFVRDVGATRSEGSVLASVKHIGVDLWQVVKSPNGILCGVLCIVPVGTGAAQAVLAQAEVAKHWGAGAHEVELVQGFLTGTISMVGCLAGGTVCSRWLNARAAYAVFGGLMAASTLVMAFLPATVGVYIGFNIVYAFIVGLCYAAFSAFVLDAIGAGHAATKYNGFASLSNTPIWYTGLVLAAAQTHFGSRGMLLTESVMGAAGIAVFVVAATVVSRFIAGRPPAVTPDGTPPISAAP